MKLEVTRTVKQKEVIDVEFPYFYKHDLMLDDSDSIIYGKIEETRHTQILISFDHRNGERRFELSTETRRAAELACYMTDEHKSSSAEYANARAEMLSAVQTA